MGRLTTQASDWPLPMEGQEAQSWAAKACQHGFGRGDCRVLTPSFPASQRGKAVKTPSSFLPPAASLGSPALGWSGLPYSQSSRFQSSGCPSRASFPSFQPPRSLQSLPSAQFSLGQGSKPLRSFRATSPQDRGCGAFEARTPCRPDPGSYLDAALGLSGTAG